MRFWKCAGVAAALICGAVAAMAEESPQFVSGPKAKKTDAGFEIAFEISRSADVLVRIVDAGGRVVRHLGCGVLGENAPPPFEKGTLKQTILWDGRDDSGKPIKGEVFVRVEAGLTPAFGELIGYDPSFLGVSVRSLSVDEQGNVLVSASPGGAGIDIDIRIFDREGRYVRTLTPFNPALPEEARPGVMVPKTTFFQSRGMYTLRGDANRLVCAPGGRLFAAWSDGSCVHVLDQKGLEIKEQQSLGLQVFALGPSGALYQVEGHTYNDKAPVTVKKVDGVTGKLLSDFAFAGREKLAAPRFYLGTRKDNGEADTKEKLNSNQRNQLRKKAKVAGDDEASFRKIVDIACDAEENIYVADAGKGAVKVYRKDGCYLGEISTYSLAGAATPLRGLRQATISRRDGAIYLVVQGPNRRSSRLVKMKGFEEPKTVWVKEFPKVVTALAIDGSAEPTLLWVGTKSGGRALLERIQDLGGKIGEVRSFGLGKPDSLGRPLALAASVDGKLFTYDIGFGRYLSVARGEDGSWHTQVFEPYEALRKNRPLYGVSGMCKTLHVDQARGHVYIAHDIRNEGWHLFRWDTEGKPVPFPETGTNSIRTRGKVRGIATDRNGSIYLSVVTTKRLPGLPGKFVPLWKFRESEVKRKLQEYVESVESEGPYPSVRPPGRIAWAHIDEYSAAGSLVKKSFASVYGPCGLGVDSRGGVYVMDTYYDVNFNAMDMASTAKGCSEIGSLAKFPPAGGRRDRDEEWVHKGVSSVSGLLCNCNTGYMTVDACDRVVVTDTARFQVKILDTAGNIIAYVGTYGNRDCAGPDSKYPEPEIAFRSPGAVAVVGDDLFVADDLNKRILRCRLGYKAKAEVPLR
ncbi:MAG: hypothetical protein AMK75_04405 [Planctomycetes bacterium SM23_65]|nr:MAG: hypothetical protein AMK75_04405 [Planctomycetes bacterium SM23_65]